MQNPVRRLFAARADPAARRGARCRSRIGRRSVGRATGRVREVHAGQRPAGDPARRPQAAGGPRQPVVPRRLEEREAGAHRFRPPLRAHDVPGLGQRHRGVLLLRRDARAPTCARAASTAPPTPTGPTTSRPCRRPTSRTCSGSNPIGWRRSPRSPTRRSSTTSATWSRTSAARGSRTCRTAAGSSCSPRISIRSGTPTPGR